jgi:hypothetical protein
MILKCYYVIYGWKQCGDNKLFEEEERFGNFISYQITGAHCLCVDLFYFYGNFGLVEFFLMSLMLSKYLHKGKYTLWKLFLLEFRKRGK